MSSLRRGHANLLCIVPILADDLFRGSNLLESPFYLTGTALLKGFLWECYFDDKPGKKNTYTHTKQPPTVGLEPTTTRLRVLRSTN